MRRNPLVYEVNARLLVQRCAREGGEPRLLAVPESYWRSLADAGFDMVWLMGVWERSPAARRAALNDGGLRNACDRALPGWQPRDVAGSPYAIRRYRLDPALGPPGDLAALRRKLNGLGLGLMVDFVASHLARDHPWTGSRPERFVQASAEAAGRYPERFFTAGARRFAHGRDPNFGPWTDTVQTNLFDPGLRRAMIGELLRIADAADGARCDMAMLDLNGVFEAVWGECLGDRPRPGGEFWSEAVAATRARHPDFVFLAEAYWETEARLLSLGFDFAYDKTLLDGLLEGNVESLRRHLASDLAGSGRAAHFVENHDEQRAAAAFGARRSMAAATVALTLPGLRLVHDGQLEGRRVKLPVQLVRAPDEQPDAEISAFSTRLLGAIRRDVFRDGLWRLVEVAAAGEAAGSEAQLLAWTWHHDGDVAVVAVNYAGAPTEGLLRLEMPPGLLRDALGGPPVPAAATGEGPRLALEPWGARVLAPAER